MIILPIGHALSDVEIGVSLKKWKNWTIQPFLCAPLFVDAPIVLSVYLSGFTLIKKTVDKPVDK
ncbi:MAG: hypothetical protein ABF461_03585 [Zymomonas mobilis subsp. pomaceae]|uniref:hypothetical protein n=1 Tax=Zymomonas mobilis TaxID=542 RepID=UPI0002EC869F|nr:hypothetical protein [Zymomonas mobilis]MDX5949425.1 hypothetical protein [Zymomonas mobilis subsp. pomaceae]